MRLALAHGLAVLAGLFLYALGAWLDLHLVIGLGGAYTALALQEAARAALVSLRPATKADRRLANTIESAVARRSLHTNRDTGAHAA